jgi:hypothetical protein
MTRSIYAYADVGRTGLGNMLFPWARAEIFCRDRDAQMLAVPWTNLKRIGPWLRGERDKRYYFRQFDNSAYVGGLKKLLVLVRGRKIDEGDAAAALDLAAGAPGRAVTVVFSGIRGRFRELLPHKPFVCDRLRSIIHRRLRPRMRAEWGRFIGVHVRRGDFVRLPPGQPIPAGRWNYQIPDEWYLACIRAVRGVMGDDLPVVLFSNARRGGLGRFFREIGNVVLADQREAIVDIVRLSQAAVLVASGSSFSQWAEFLGGMPSIWYPAGWRQFLTPETEDYECEADSQGNPPDSFLNVLRGLA